MTCAPVIETVAGGLVEAQLGASAAAQAMRRALEAKFMDCSSIEYAAPLPEKNGACWSFVGRQSQKRLSSGASSFIITLTLI